MPVISLIENGPSLPPLIPPAKPGGCPRSVDMRQILNGIFYVLRSGGAWRLLPHDYPAWSTVYDYFRKWRNDGVWEQMVTTLRERLRVQAGRKATPVLAAYQARQQQERLKAGAAWEDHLLVFCNRHGGFSSRRARVRTFTGS